MRAPFPMTPGKTQRGFSLVELMVAMTIGLIVLGGVAYLYMESRQSFRGTDNLSRMQESARYALETMAREIRMAGYRGCASSAGTFHNTLNLSTETAYNFELPINGYDASGTGWSPALPADTGGLSGLGIAAGTDAIILRSAAGAGAAVVQEPGKTSADVKVATPNDLQIGEIVMVANCKTASVLQITSLNVVGAGQNVVHNTGTGGPPGNATTDLGEKYSDSGGEMIKMQSKTYFIRESKNSTPANKRYSLWQYDNYKPSGGDNPAELAGGVENMQILYGVDATGDGVVETYVKAGAVANWQQVAAVRISLLVVGDDNIATSAQQYTYDGAAVTATDRRLRQVFTTTVSVRNRTQ